MVIICLFEDNWYDLRMKHKRGLQLFAHATIKRCFRRYLCTWRDCHVGINQMIRSLGDKPADVEVVIRNFSEMDGFKVECEEDGEEIEGQFVDTEFDETLCFHVDGGEFTFVVRKLEALKCNYRQTVA